MRKRGPIVFTAAAAVAVIRPWIASTRWALRQSLRRRTALGLFFVLVFVTVPAPTARAELPLPTQRPLAIPVKVPRSLMPSSFASDPASHVAEYFEPHRLSASFGDPIDVASGAYYFSTTDFSIHGRTLDFVFTRFYNSADATYEPDGSAYLGAGWRHNYWWEIADMLAGQSGCDGNLHRGDGTYSRIFPATDGDYSACTFDGTTTTVTMRDQTRYLFAQRYDYREDPESLPQSIYRLVRIEHPTGNRLTLAYTASPRGWGMPVLSTLTDTVGRVITFGYDSQARITRVADPTGRAVTFTYDGLSRMTSATDTAGGVTSYGYSDTTRHITSYTDPDGRAQATNSYAVNGTVYSQTNGEGYTTTRTSLGFGAYDVIDGRGTRTTYYYSTNGLYQERVWANNTYYDTLYGYDNYGNRTSITDRLGNVTSFSYATIKHGNVLSRTDPPVTGGTPVTNYQYDAKNNLTQITDPRGYTTTRTFDTSTNVLLSETRKIDATTYATTIYTYGDPANPGLPTAITAPRGFSTQLQYDGSGNLTRKQDADGDATTYTYDSLGRPRTVTDAEGHSTMTDYDSADRAVAVTDPLLHVTRYAYDRAGNRTSVTDRNGNTATYAYDRNSRLKTVQQSPQPGTTYTTSLTRDANGNVTRTTEANGVLHDTSYDAFGRVSSTMEYTSQGTLTRTYARDAMGNVTALTYPQPPPPAQPFRAQATADNGQSGGATLTISRPIGTQTGDVLLAFVYADSPWLSTIDPPPGWIRVGGPTSNSYHIGAAFYRFAQGLDPLSWTWTFATSTPAIGSILAYGNVSQVTPLSPTGASANSGATATVTAVGTTTGYANEMAVASFSQFGTSTIPSTPTGWTNRVSAIPYTGPATIGDLKVEEKFSASPGATGDAVWQTGNTWRWVAFMVGLVLTSPPQPNPPPPSPLVINYTYDALARLTSVSAPDVSIGYGYDLAGNRVTLTSGSDVTLYSYDGRGRMLSSSSPSAAVSYAYDIDGNRTSVTYPAGGAVTYAYTPADRLSTVTDWAGRQSTYTYRPTGLVSGVTYPNGMSANYTYDALGRLTQLTNAIGPTTITSHTYVLDPEGNRTQVSEFVSGLAAGGGTDTINYTYDSLNRLLSSVGVTTEAFVLDGASNITSRTGPSATYTYDNADRLQSDGVRNVGWSVEDRTTSRASDAFAYDGLDRLTSASVSGTVRTFTYDGDGLLLTRTVNGSPTSIAWDSTMGPGRALTVGNTQLVYGLGPLYGVAGATVTTFARDGQKSVRAELAGSAVTASWRYRAYGEISQSNGASSPSILGFASQLVDSSGLYYMRARWYDPRAARFLTRDSFSGRPSTSSTSNEYGYASGNPLAVTDPTGLCPMYEPACLAYFALSLITTQEEADAAVGAAQSSNPLVALTGYVELSAGLVAGGSLAIVGTAAVWMDVTAAAKVALRPDQVAYAQSWTRQIAFGHAREHLGQFEDLGIKSEGDLATHVESIVSRPSATKTLERGRSAYWDEATGTVVIRDPAHRDGGTVFRPDHGRSFFDNELK